MKLYHKNPRTLSKKQFSQLEEWLRELGDLSGIVHDLNSDEIVGGNQRSRVFDIDKCQVEITQQLDAPDEQGTVALGFIVWEGKRYSYRQVRWTDKQCEKANIVANKSGGEWDWDTLANEFEVDELLEWGFSEAELGMGEAAQTQGEPRATLADRFIVPPFSVLDARQGYWQDRKRAWLALDIQSELGRGEGIVPNGTERPASQDGAWMRHSRNAPERERERVTRMAMDNDPMQRKVAYDAR